MIHTPGHATDLEAIADGYVAVTPLHLDLTHDKSLGPARRRSTPDARPRSARPRGPDHVMLRRKSPLPIWVQIGWRVALVFGLLAFAIAVHWFERDGLQGQL